MSSNPVTLLAVRAFLALLLSIILFAPVVIRFAFRDDGVRYFVWLFDVSLNELTCASVAFPAALANYAFLSGLLLSGGGPPRGGYVRIHPQHDAASSLVHLARNVVGMAFDQGRRRRFAWPPLSLAVPMRLDNDSDELVRRVRPVFTTCVGLPVLLLVLVVSTIPPLRALLRRARAGGGAVRTAVVRFRYALVDTGSLVLGTAKAIALAAVTYLADVLMPYAFGVAMIVVTATGIVLYGIAHVAVTAIAQSGFLGLNKESTKTLLAVLRLQKRLLHQLNWSWWWRAFIKYERRHRARRRLYRAYLIHHHYYREEGEDDDNSNNHNHNGSYGDCPLLAAYAGLRSYRSVCRPHDEVPDSGDADNGSDDESSDTEDSQRDETKRGEKKRVIHYHHHHHHHHHHHQGGRKRRWSRLWQWIMARWRWRRSKPDGAASASQASSKASSPASSPVASPAPGERSAAGNNNQRRLRRMRWRRTVTHADNTDGTSDSNEQRHPAWFGCEGYREVSTQTDFKTRTKRDARLSTVLEAETQADIDAKTGAGVAARDIDGSEAKPENAVDSTSPADPLFAPSTSFGTKEEQINGQTQKWDSSRRAKHRPPPLPRQLELTTVEW